MKEVSCERRERERERVRREERINTEITSFGENPQEKIRYYIYYILYLYFKIELIIYCFLGQNYKKSILFNQIPTLDNY